MKFSFYTIITITTDFAGRQSEHDQTSGRIFMLVCVPCGDIEPNLIDLLKTILHASRLLLLVKC